MNKSPIEIKIGDRIKYLENPNAYFKDIFQAREWGAPEELIIRQPRIGVVTKIKIIDIPTDIVGIKPKMYKFKLSNGNVLLFDENQLVDVVNQ